MNDRNIKAAIATLKRSVRKPSDGDRLLAHNVGVAVAVSRAGLKLNRSDCLLQAQIEILKPSKHFRRPLTKAQMIRLRALAEKNPWSNRRRVKLGLPKNALSPLEFLKKVYGNWLPIIARTDLRAVDRLLCSRLENAQNKRSISKAALLDLLPTKVAITDAIAASFPRAALAAVNRIELRLQRRARRAGMRPPSRNL